MKGRKTVMKKTCCLLLLLLCLILQACEKADNLKYETSSYANFSASENSENIAKTESTAETEIAEIEETKEDTNCIDIVVEKNQNMIEDYLKNFPAEMKWIQIGLFDFTKDGNPEIILSQQYVINELSVISYNYVYDQQGNELFAFPNGSLWDTDIYTSRDSMEFYISSKIHWGSQNDTFLYCKTEKQNEWKREPIIVMWDMRKAGFSDDSECCPIFYIPLEKEQDWFCNTSDELSKLRDDETLKRSEEDLEEYTKRYENLQKNQIDIRGGIYCAEDKIIMEINEEQIELASERFFLQPDENMICVYEGTMELETVKHRYALYKETAEQDIIFVNILLVEEETGDYYTWEGENLVPVSRQEIEKIKLPDTSESETESELFYQNITVEELLDKVVELLKQQGYSGFNLIYDGTTDFIDRTYYIVCTYEDFEDHIIREQSYYIDRKTGYLYHVEEEPDFLRTELYYLGDLQF